MNLTRRRFASLLAAPFWLAWAKLWPKAHWIDPPARTTATGVTLYGRGPFTDPKYLAAQRELNRFYRRLISRATLDS